MPYHFRSTKAHRLIREYINTRKHPSWHNWPTKSCCYPRHWFSFTLEVLPRSSCKRSKDWLKSMVLESRNKRWFLELWYMFLCYIGGKWIVLNPSISLNGSMHPHPSTDDYCITSNTSSSTKSAAEMILKRPDHLGNFIVLAKNVRQATACQKSTFWTDDMPVGEILDFAWLSKRSVFKHTPTSILYICMSKR